MISAASKTSYNMFLGKKSTFIMFVWFASHTHHGLKSKMCPAGEGSRDP